MDAVIVMITIALMLFAGCLVYAIGANQLFKMIKDERTAKLMNRVTGASIVIVAIVLVLTF